MTEQRQSRSKETILRLKTANCKNCYKCVRACPTKAIRMVEDQAEIIEDRCIYCGKCYMVCPQDAREMIGDLDRIKAMIADGEEVYFSISSSLTAYFRDGNLRRLAVLLKKLGVTRVEEMAEGAGRMLQEYKEILLDHEMKNIIGSYCPSMNFLIQKYFPKLTKWLIPVETPLEIHARMLRATYGPSIRVVGVGPCIAYHKLADLSEDGNLIDAYLTFEELEEWFKEENLVITEEEDPDTHYCSHYRWKYPDEPQGVIKALPPEIKYNYKMWEINGETRAANMFRQAARDMDNYFITATACGNSCLGGPIIRLCNRDSFIGQDRWLTSMRVDVSEKKMNPCEDAEVSVRKSFKPIFLERKKPNKEDLISILSLIGKKERKDLLDCGGCGYSTCIEKAVAVYQGMADPFMCIPNSRDKAEEKSNLLFDNLPNGVLVLDKEFNILEANPAAQEIFGADEEFLQGRPVEEYIDESFVNHAKYKELDVLQETVECRNIDKILLITFFRIKRHDISMMLFFDRTESSQRIREAKALRMETINVTQEVVEKQMRIAQEIASLLGETTAESKLAFNKLKNLLVMRNDDEQ